MRKLNEENERIKRRYAQYLRNAKRLDHTTVDKALDAILKFEANTKFKSFKFFNIEQAVAFVEGMETETSKTTGKPLSKATIKSALAAVRKFFIWLAGEQGYKSRICYSDADYFSLNLKDSRVAEHKRDIPYPTLDQIAHLFRSMPEDSDIARRNKGFVAFLVITALRDGAIASLKLKHIDLIDQVVHQDAREVRTKFSKTFSVWFMPVDRMYLDYFNDYVTYLRSELLFGHEDPLFPKPKMGIGIEGGFQVQGLSRDMYASANALRNMLGKVFEEAGLQKFPPHSFRKTSPSGGRDTTECRRNPKHSAKTLATTASQPQLIVTCQCHPRSRGS